MELLIFVSNNVLKRAASLLLLSQLELGLMAHFISQVQLLDSIIKVELALVVLLPNLFMLNR